MEYKIKAYNEWLSQQSYEKLPIGLLDGKMGLCLYWYQQSHLYNNNEYEIIADKLLDEVIDGLKSTKSLRYENGIIGIAFSFLRLINEKHIEGKPDEIMKDVDDRIFQNLCFDIMNQACLTVDALSCLLWGLLYFSKRLHSAEMNKNDKIIFQGIIVKGLNCIEENLRSSTIAEPTSFDPFGYHLPLFIHLLYEIDQLGFYSYKVKLICREWAERLRTSFPLSIGHRYMLSIEMMRLVPSFPVTIARTISEHAELLLQQSNLSQFFHNEIRNKNLSIQSGLAGLVYYATISGAYDVRQYLDIIQKKIDKSNVWNLWNESKDKGDYIFDLGRSITGTIYVYQRIKENNEND